MALFSKKIGPIGIDVSDGSIEMAQVRPSVSGAVTINGYGRLVLEPGIIKEGRLIKPQEFVLSLRKLLSAPQFGKIDGKQLVFSVPEHQCYHYAFVFDRIGDTRLPYNAIKEQLEQTLPFELQDAMWDWTLVRQAGSKSYVYVLAVPKDVLAEYQQALASAGLVMRVAESQVISAGRHIWSAVYLDEPMLHVDMGTHETSVSTVDDVGVHQSSVMDVGVETMVADLVKELKLTPPTARKILLTIGLRNLKHPQVQKIHAVIKRYMQRVFEEAQQHLSYYHAQEHFKQGTVTRASFIGGGMLIPGVPEILSQSLKLHVETMNKHDRFRPALSAQDFVLYANALGAAMHAVVEKDEQINVLIARRISDDKKGFLKSFAEVLRRKG